MQHFSTVLLSVACLALLGEATTVKTRLESTSAMSLILHSAGHPGKVDTKAVVSSLGEVAKGLQALNQVAYDVAMLSKKDCKNQQRDLEMALAKDQRQIGLATEDYQKNNAQVQSLQASLAHLKGEISRSNSELDNLQAKTKKMRADKGLLKKSASSALYQIEVALEKTERMENEKHRKSLATLKKQVSSLESLSDSLSFLQTTSDEEEVESPVLILRADKQDLFQASQETQRGFNEEEKKLQDLIEVERKKLANLEASMQELQPAISNKLQQAMEINRTLDASNRGLFASEDLLAIGGAKCGLTADGLGALQKQRGKVANDVLMASALIQHMDTALFLAQDVRGLKRGAVSILQVGASSEDAPPRRMGKSLSLLQERRRVVKDIFSDDSIDEGEELERTRENALFMQKLEAVSVPNATGSTLSLLQERRRLSKRLVSDDAMGETEAFQRTMEAVSAVTTEREEGPFDKVTQMISGLVASLKAQANEEVNQHQFCQDGLSDSRRHRVAKKLDMDLLDASIRWSTAAIGRIDDDMTYFEEEIVRLDDLRTVEAKEIAAENTRVKKESAEHQLANEVIEKVVIILNQLCELDGAALIQVDKSTPALRAARGVALQQTSKKGSRFHQCKEASNLLKSASTKVKDLDSMTKEHLEEYLDLADRIDGFLQGSKEDREWEQGAAKQARAQRDSEHATAVRDVRESAKELKLIDEAKRELEHSCSHIETREEKMAKRKEEIDALKEALKVLEGEAIPA